MSMRTGADVVIGGLQRYPIVAAGRKISDRDVTLAQYNQGKGQLRLFTRNQPYDDNVKCEVSIHFIHCGVTALAP